MKERIKLAFQILIGKSIIIYEENTKIVVAMIGGKEAILQNGLDIAVDKYVRENNEEIRYMKGK